MESFPASDPPAYNTPGRSRQARESLNHDPERANSRTAAAGVPTATRWIVVSSMILVVALVVALIVAVA
jgi:hypothetical protein